VNLRRFWVRKDREQYLLSGVIITCAIGGFVSSYWHFTDRMSVRRNISIKKTLTPEKERGKLRETQYAPPRLSVGATRYYRLDEGIIPAMPELGKNEGE
jgi:hypothetical protein